MQDSIVKAGGQNAQPFLGSLNVSEVETREKYNTLFPGQAAQLNQNPGAGHAMVSTDMWMHTLIRNCGLNLGYQKPCECNVMCFVLLPFDAEQLASSIDLLPENSRMDEKETCVLI